MEDKKQLKWLEKHPILKEEDVPSLEAGASIHQFKHGKDQNQAEQDSHKDYLKNHAIQAMAHHLIGSKAALAVNNIEAAMQHGKCYEAASNNAGFELGKVPDEVLEAIKIGEHHKLYKFKGHDADQFFLPKTEEGKPDTKPEELHSNNSNIKKLIDGLAKFRDILN
jgi:hypothetical protein